jgi:hypothetical protein
VIVVADERAAPRLDLAVSVELRLERTIVSQAEPPPHDLVLGFCAGDPIGEFAAVAPGVARCGFASPFLAVVPGTDTYAGEL